MPSDTPLGAVPCVEPGLGLSKILSLPILYGACHTRGGSGVGAYIALYCVWANYRGAN